MAKAATMCSTTMMISVHRVQRILRNDPKQWRNQMVMTIESPHWREFCDRLDRAISKQGCDARTLRLAEKVLRDMGGIDIEASLEYFREHGGYCDCEILVNIDWNAQIALEDALDEAADSTLH
jgi:uncharacterized protein DUF2695